MKRKILPIVLFFFLVVSSSLVGEAIHILQNNETLYSIAKKYGCALEELMRANGIDDPRSLQVGMNLIIPDKHTVSKGETLYGIAKNYGIPLAKLLELNGIDENYLLKVGDVLSIPRQNEEKKRITEERTSESKEQEEVAKPAEGEEPGRDKGSQAEKFPAAKEKRVSEAAGGEWPITGTMVSADGKLKGVRIAGKRGDPVRSISSGKVVWAGPYRGFGKVVLVQSKDRYVYVYGGNEEIFVTLGQNVDPGMVLSSLGINPHTQQPELFFTVFRNGKPIDPEKAPRL
jgi:murein DD-endopeptidase MepM/ murein hydrolase activator NlpD